MPEQTKQAETLREFIERAQGEAPLNLWQLLEVCPAQFDAIADLFSWSLNYDYDAPGNPWLMFIDLVGFSSEEYGVKVSRFFTEDDASFGWVELDKLGSALRVWADYPSECETVARLLVMADPHG